MKRPLNVAIYLLVNENENRLTKAINSYNVMNQVTDEFIMF